MSELKKIVNKIIGKNNIETKIELQGDMFIEVETSSSEKQNNHIKLRKCVICGDETIGTICEKNSCFEEFIKQN